jgi:hypothetical protein
LYTKMCKKQYNIILEKPKTFVNKLRTVRELYI